MTATLESRSTASGGIAASSMPYPRYARYADVGKAPSFLLQEFPQPGMHDDEIYYPVNARLEPCFTTPAQSRKFGAASFCGFLADTIEVEQNLVIPAVAAVRRLPYAVPEAAAQDLFTAVADEGFHAEQSLHFLSRLRARFGLFCPTRTKPLFLRRLDLQRATERRAVRRDLITVLNGIVTETRISIELSRFAGNAALAACVRRICRSHADDEAIHASQFRALGRWLWSQFDEATRVVAARFIAMSTIARSLPDMGRIANFLQQSTERTNRECRALLRALYSDDAVIGDMLFAAKPTIDFFESLGTWNYFPFRIALDEERERLAFATKREQQR